VVFFSDAEGIGRLGAEAMAAVELPKVDPFVSPVLYAIPVQLLTYHAAVVKGTDVGQPRNLAKSVTVEQAAPAGADKGSWTATLRALIWRPGTNRRASA
jgi:hypothetical protein